MVQVDVFWTYALGAGFAAAAGRQLKEASDTGESPFQSPYFLRALLFLSILFVPSGVCLLWAFPGWETMFAGDRTLPAWIVTLFCVTNITQGILGFWVASKLIEKGRLYWAHLQWVIGYMLMFFILVHGWDGTGWRRFFYAGDIADWRAGVDYSIWAFAYSDVALTLYAFGLVILPVMFIWMSTWMKEGYRLADVDPRQESETTMGSLTRTMLKMMFVYALGSAIIASLLIHLIGWIAGVPVFIVLLYLAGIRQGGLFHKQIGRLTLETDPT